MKAPEMDLRKPVMAVCGAGRITRDVACELNILGCVQISSLRSFDH